MGADFAYNSIMTAIVKHHPYLQEDPGLRDQLLGYARTSLSSLKDMLMQTRLLVDVHTFKISISWSVGKGPPDVIHY